ncbi:hypothetical protein RND71_033318 [Anisodus tanguticus]|uniref:Uncharacterized protein n=1 Tax=Anisodus tanguticus TaxID=243964 RepID=A0AAE1R7H0_9SOLA|nr:hypothetical protein RND71_033318 [Anisodus tanguticus]
MEQRVLQANYSTGARTCVSEPWRKKQYDPSQTQRVGNPILNEAGKEAQVQERRPAGSIQIQSPSKTLLHERI